MKLKKRLQYTEIKLKSALKECANLKTINSNLQDRLDGPVTLTDFNNICDTLFAGKPTMCSFIKNQARLCTVKAKGRRYTPEEKQFALMVHFYGAKAYRFLKKVWCLPSLRTLQRATENWEIGVGLSDFVFKVLSLKVQTLNKKGRDCVLCADEMSLKTFLYYNYAKDEVIGFHDVETHKTTDVAKSVMVLMMRGIHDTWKQPIGYYFVGSTCSGFSLKNIIYKCILKLTSISFNVRVMISDMGSNFKSFADNVGVTPENPYFKVGTKEIIYMFDPPHLLKSTRNNFFNYRLVSEDKIIESKHLKQFYNSDAQRTHRLAPKLTEKHMNPGPFQKMKVKFASQVFSKTVVCAMTTCMTDGSLPNTAASTIEFIDEIDNLFDIFNSRMKIKPQEDDVESDDELEPKGAKRFCLPFKNAEYQNNFLLKMFNFFKNVNLQKFNTSTKQWHNIKKSYNIKFLTGWMISIAGLIKLHNILSKEYDEEIELMTRRLNQDCLENLFGTMRIQNGNCINPTTIQLQRTFKKLFSLSYFEYNEGANCLEDIDQVLSNLNKIPAEDLKTVFPENQKVIQINPLPIDSTNYRSLELPERNAFTYICGYLIMKCYNMHSCETCIRYGRSTTKLSDELFFTHFKSHQHSSISMFSSLMTPDCNFYQYIFELDIIFTNQFPTLAPSPKVGQKLKTLMLNVYFEHPCEQFPHDYLLNLYIRFRIYTTLTRTNRNLQIPRMKNRKLQILCNL